MMGRGTAPQSRPLKRLRMAFVQLAAIQGKSEAEIKGRHGQRYVGVPYHVRNPAWSTSAMPSGGSCTACGTRGSRTGPFPRKVPLSYTFLHSPWERLSQ